jgi:predicted neuraminidase
MFIFDKAPFASCHASTLVEGEPEKLLAAWFGGTREGTTDVKIWLSRFDGTTWSAPEVVAEEMGQPCWNPVLFRDRTKAMWLWYKAGPNPMSWTGYFRKSTDNGKTWGKVEQLPAGLLGPIRCKPLQLADGTLLAGTSVESHRAWGSWIERSKDDGKTWQRFGPINVPGKLYGLIQPTLFEAKDGRIVALMRSRDSKKICQSESKDCGETWSPAVETELPNPNSGVDAVKVDSGDVWLIYNHTDSGRSPLNLARSTDDGKTWKMVHKLEEEAGEFSYPALIQSSRGMLEMTYTWKRRHIKHVSLDPTKIGI